MQVIELPFDPECILGPADQPNRADGRPPSIRSTDTLHLSKIYGDIENTLVKRDPMDENTLKCYRAGGFLWEQALELAFINANETERYVRPGEITRDGITGSPDLIDAVEWAVEECKCTWRSSAKLDALEKNFWIWMVQMKGYCYLIGTQVARLRVFFINGNYRGSGPQVRYLEFKFSQKEITDNWAMLVNHAKMRGWLKDGAGNKSNSAGK